MSRLATSLTLALGLAAAAPSFGGNADGGSAEVQPNNNNTIPIGTGVGTEIGTEISPARIEKACSASFLGVTTDNSTGWNNVSKPPFKPEAVLRLREALGSVFPELVVTADQEKLSLIRDFLATQDQNAPVVSCWNQQIEQAYNDLGDALKKNGFVPTP